jgi:signal transduction histidine kinase
MGQHWFDELEAVAAAAEPVTPASIAEDEFADLADRIDELSEGLTDRVGAEHDRASRASTAILVMLLVTAGVLVASAAVSYVIIRHSITRPLRRLVTQIGTVADGGLGQSIEATGPVDLVQVGDAAERMRRRLLADAERRTESAVIAGHLAESALMAGQLHDDQVQAMTLVSIRLQQVARRVGDDPVLADAVAQAREATTRAIDRLRRMIFDLHSPVLDSEGLVAALEVYADETFDDTVRTSVRGDTGPVDDATAGLAYRLAREAVFNAFKHASPSTVDVTVERRLGSLVVTVSDDGIGFERTPGELPEPTPGHLGIRHAADLADAAGGRWDVRTEPGAGTTVTIALPTRTHASDDDESRPNEGSDPAVSRAAAVRPRSTRGA